MSDIPKGFYKHLDGSIVCEQCEKTLGEGCQCYDFVPREDHRPGIGMPADLLLQEFGQLIIDAFGNIPYHVGSSLRGKKWRDVDVRLILDDDQYEKMELGDPKYPHDNPKWVSLVLAYSALGKAMTGLPIDFQIQQQTQANKDYSEPRSALFSLKQAHTSSE